MKARSRRAEKGATLIVVILVSAFMLAVGVAIMMITGTGPKVSVNVRNQNEAFNAAEAGFEAARLAIEGFFLDGVWQSLNENCLREPAGIDLPAESLYFRKLTDEEILQTVNSGDLGVVFFDQPFIQNQSGQFDPRYTYTVFLIDDEAGGGTPDLTDVLMVCIGVVRIGNRVVSTARLEVLIGVDSAESAP
ncbi:MAG: PilX N-terminal domain-containing pilus assembly protein [Candidatus Aminicenantales bacterium]